MRFFSLRYIVFVCFSLVLLKGVLISQADQSYGQGLLKTADISSVMKQIFSEHIGKKEMTEQILQRSFETYINQFDPQRIYLLQSEVAPYFNRPSDSLKKVIDAYKRHDYTPFQELNDLFQRAIARSRAMRKGIEAGEKNQLFHLGLQKRAETASVGGLLSFARTEEDLKVFFLRDLQMYIESQKKQFGDSFTPQRKEEVIANFEARQRAFENQYLYQNEQGKELPAVERENLFTLHVLKALASSLDAHTAFYEPSEAYDIRIRLQKEFKGIGLVLKDAPEGVVVVHLLDEGPAAKSQKIEVGDILIGVDGKSVTQESFEKVMSLLHGEKGQELSLTFLKKQIAGSDAKKSVAGAESTYTVLLKRESIVLNEDRVSVVSEPFGGGVIGVISLHSFYQGPGISSEQDVREAILKLQKQGTLKGLILDLRDNGGGFLSQAVKVAGLFITDGVIVISKYANGEERIYRDVDGTALFDGPLIVLTSKATASAAEIVAQALQDYGVALVVGDEHTYGKGTIQAQTVTDNQSASYFKVTVGKYYTVSGKTPQKQGVSADIVAPGHWYGQEIGEKYADSVGADAILPLYNDSLGDVPLYLRGWYLKYYIPKLQRKVSFWREQLPVLRKNSEYRIAQNKNYQHFLKRSVQEEEEWEDEWGTGEKKKKTHGEDDLQLQEAIHVLQDMILLNYPSTNKKGESVSDRS